MSGVVFYDYWRSSASYRVRIALNSVGVEHRVLPVDLMKGEQFSSAHLAINPQGAVPALEIDGVKLTQSLAIIEYLSETRGDGCLLPEDPVARAHIRALCHVIAMEIHPVCNSSVVAHIEDMTGEESQITKQWMNKYITRGLKAFEILLQNRPEGDFCYGERVGMADICLIPQLYNARRWEVDYSDLRNIISIEKACYTLPEFEKAHPDNNSPD